MGRFAGKLSVLAAIALLAAFLVSCGGGEDGPDEAGTTASAQQKGGAGEGSGSGVAEARRKSGGAKEEEASGGEASGETSGEPASGAADRHDDSGGGSGQFRVEGGDNSVQEFGEEADEPEFDQAAQVVHGFFDARVRGDWAAACSYLARPVVDALRPLARGELEGAGCAGLLAGISGGAPRSALEAAARADIGSLRVEGGRAFVLYHGAAGLDYAMPMVREDGQWKVGSLAGTPIS